MSLEFVKVSFSYVITKYIVIVLNFLRTIIVAAALGPTILGEYAFIVILLEYMHYSNLGIFHAMNKEVSVNLDKQDSQNFIKRVINNTISFQFLNSLFLGFLFLIFFLLEMYEIVTNSLFDSKYLAYIFVLAAVYQVKSFIFVYLRLFDEFFDIVKIELFSAIFVFVGIYLFIDNFGITAILLISIIGNLLIIIPKLVKIKSLRFQVEKSLLKSLILLALPLLLFNVLVLLTTSIDRIMISQLVSSNKATLGIFHFGYLLSFGVMTAFNSVIFLLVPKVLRQFNRKSKDVDLMLDQTKLVENTVILIAVLSITVLPLFVNEFMPQYFQSILVMQLLLLAYSINGLAFLPGSHLIANNWQLKLIPSFILALISAFILNYMSIFLGYGIYGVAIATVFTFSIYTFGLFVVYLHLMKQPLVISLIRVFWKIFTFSFFAIIFLYEQMPFYFLIILYLAVYGSELVNIIRRYLPVIRSYLS